MSAPLVGRSSLPQRLAGRQDAAWRGLERMHLAFFRGYLADLIAAVKQAAADGASVDEMKQKLGDQLASKYEQGMSKHPLGQYRARIGANIDAVYQKVVKKS